MAERVAGLAGTIAVVTGRRLLRVALLGLTNSGKSTLCNALVGEEVTIATAKRHTTRTRVRAIFVDGGTQVVLTDTPGVLELDSESRRERSRNPGAFKGIKNAAPDALMESRLHLLVVDASATDSLERAEHTGRELSRLLALAAPDNARATAEVVFAINKMDRVKRAGGAERIAERIAAAAQLRPAAVFSISALTGDGVPELRQRLVQAATPAEWAYADPNQRTDQTLGERALEILRAEVHHVLHRQLPYSVRQEDVCWSEDAESGALELDLGLSMPQYSELVVLRSALGSIHSATQPKLASLFERQVKLKLHTKLRSNRGF
ncbi:P-loop containing nucleoside triphosphate hydrolase protein [Pavlovales sp. CCMP2436]|nr:P-loop containing nucleoside triphosphate hydrolase protein [Pavlovales sp. CCMP2436]